MRASPPRRRRPLPTRPATAPAQPGTFLVVEDRPAAGELLRELLHAERYRVALAVGLAEAERLLAAGGFALVLADTLRGSSTGQLGDRWAALERLRALAGATPVVLTTAYPVDLFADYRARGFAALLPKPFHLDDVLAAVRRILAASAAS